MWFMEHDKKDLVNGYTRSHPQHAPAGVVKPKRKPRIPKKDKLSLDQVRKNHVVSEQRRRELVRSIYDSLVEVVPDLAPSERRSEILIYLKTINHLKWLYKRNSYLRKLLAEKYECQGKSVVEVPNRLIWELNSSSRTSEEMEEQGK